MNICSVFIHFVLLNHFMVAFKVDKDHGDDYGRGQVTSCSMGTGALGSAEDFIPRRPVRMICSYDSVLVLQPDCKVFVHRVYISLNSIRETHGI